MHVYYYSICFQSVAQSEEQLFLPCSERGDDSNGDIWRAGSLRSEEPYLACSGNLCPIRRWPLRGTWLASDSPEGVASLRKTLSWHLLLLFTNVQMTWSWRVICILPFFFSSMPLDLLGMASWLIYSEMWVSWSQCQFTMACVWCWKLSFDCIWHKCCRMISELVMIHQFLSLWLLLLILLPIEIDVIYSLLLT